MIPELHIRVMRRAKTTYIGWYFSGTTAEFHTEVPGDISFTDAVALVATELKLHGLPEEAKQARQFDERSGAGSLIYGR